MPYPNKLFLILFLKESAQAKFNGDKHIIPWGKGMLHQVWNSQRHTIAAQAKFNGEEQIIPWGKLCYIKFEILINIKTIIFCWFTVKMENIFPKPTIFFLKGIYTHIYIKNILIKLCLSSKNDWYA